MPPIDHHGVIVGHVAAPHIDYAGLSPFIVLGVGALVMLLLGLVRSAAIRERVVPFLTLVVLGGAIGTEIWRFTHHATIIHGALAIDDLSLLISLICAVAGFATVLLSWHANAPREAGHGEYHGLLLFSILGMNILASAQDIITLFVGIELLSIPLYVLCAAEHRREGSLESGLKYLIIGSVGSATLVYGLAMVYGATGQTGFAAIANTIANGQNGGILGDPLLLTGLALVLVGFAFKASVAPFHQWTPDVYEGAPTPITALMATATKAAALAIFLRFFDVAAVSEATTWQPIIAAVAAITIIVGNVGALTQTSLKRMLGYSGVAQAGYMLSGVVVGTRLGISATVLYLGVYLAMNIAAFAAIQGVEAVTGSDELPGFSGLGARAPVLAWPLTIAMLGLSGIPGTVGFVGKFQLLHALVNGDYTWLGIVLVLGSMISLGYYLRVVAAVWMSRGLSTHAPVALSPGIELAPIAGGSPEADEEGADPADPGSGSAAGDVGSSRQTGGLGADTMEAGAPAGGQRASSGGAEGEEPLDPDASFAPHPEVALVALVFGAASVVFGVIPSLMFHLASHAGAALPGLF